MANNRQRPSLMVLTIDRDKATQLIKDKLSEYNTDGIVSQPMVIMNTKKGLATICTEGVGWVKDDNGLYTLLYYSERSFSDGYVDITRDELLSIVSDEQTDLATFIRTFGDRLESNFDIWYYSGFSLDQTITTMLVSN